MKRRPIRNVIICVTALVLPTAASAGAEPVTTISNVNLRAAASATGAILGRIPAGGTVQISRCAEWCEVEWQGKKGFAIASALDRRGTKAAAAVADDNPVPMSLPKIPESPRRTEGPYFGGAGPSRGFGFFGYRGRW